MSWTKVGGLVCLATMMMAGSALAEDDSYFGAALANVKARKSVLQPLGLLSNAGIDRLLDINAKHDSVLRNEETSQDDMAGFSSAPIGDIASAPSRGLYLLAGIGSSFALGLGLCCASMISGRQRTIRPFTAGIVRVR